MNRVLKIPAAALEDENLSAANFKVLAAVYSYTDYATSKCRASLKQIAATAGFDVLSTAQSMKALRSRGYLNAVLQGGRKVYLVTHCDPETAGGAA